MSEPRNDEFLLSRIEAQGWNAAQRLMTGEPRVVAEARIAMLNPHPSDPARARWRTGFDNAMLQMRAR